MVRGGILRHQYQPLTPSSKAYPKPGTGNWLHCCDPYSFPWHPHYIDDSCVRGAFE